MVDLTDGPNLAKLGPEWAQVRPPLTESGPVFAEIALERATLGHSRPNIAGAYFGRCSTDPAHHVATWGKGTINTMARLMSTAALSRESSVLLSRPPPNPDAAHFPGVVVGARPVELAAEADKRRGRGGRSPTDAPRARARTNPYPGGAQGPRPPRARALSRSLSV